MIFEIINKAILAEFHGERINYISCERICNFVKEKYPGDYNLRCDFNNIPTLSFEFANGEEAIFFRLKYG